MRSDRRIMKKRSPSIFCFLFFIMSLFVFLIHLSSFSRSTYFLSSRNPEIKFQRPKVMKPVHPLPMQSPQASLISCDRSHWTYDICKINGPTVLDPAASTLYLVDPTARSTPPMVEMIRPYPRKWENFTMARIRKLAVTSGPSSPPCEAQHNAPALVFSAGGYTGNFFHEFNDGIIPLFITVNSVHPNNQDLVLVISKARDWWVSKYADLLQGFSKYPIINLDNDTSTHCFSNVTVGLITHGFMQIDPTLMPNSTNLTHLRIFLDRVYSSSKNYLPNLNISKLRPRLILVSRSGNVGRIIWNQNEVKQLAQNVGFDVIVFEPKPQTPLRKAYALIKSSHAMIGVHGAALTHFLFLREGAVLGQVVPLGIEWVAKTCFEIPGRVMGLDYMEYKIGFEESSLIDKYGKNSMLVKDPSGFQGKNWSSGIMDIYLKEQNVRLDLPRFRKYLEKVYYKAKKFMDTEG